MKEKSVAQLLVLEFVRLRIFVEIMSGAAASERSRSGKSVSRASSDSQSSNGEQGENIFGLDVVKGLKSTCKVEAVSISVLRMPSNYSVRCPEPDERVYYPGENEVGVYMKLFLSRFAHPLTSIHSRAPLLPLSYDIVTLP